MYKHPLSLLSAALLRRIVLGAFLLLAGTLSVRADEPSVVFRNSIDGVVWIRNYLPNKQISYGTGFLIDRERRLVVTNWHVTDEEAIMDVFFPVRDKDGLLINDHEFYTKNLAILKQLGFYTVGRMTAKSKEKDLAVLRLDHLPPTARPLALATAEPKTGAPLHVIGNPDGRKLWRWCAGSVRTVANFKSTFNNGLLQVDFRALHLFGSTFFGNSGGPVLDDEGKVLGVVQSGSEVEGGMNATAIHASEVEKLVATVRSFQVFSVVNKTKSPIRIQVKWGERDWKKEITMAAGVTWWHWCPGDLEPRIRFAHHGKLENATVVKTYTKWMGAGVRPMAVGDAWEYYFAQKNGNQLELLSYPNGSSR